MAHGIEEYRKERAEARDALHLNLWTLTQRLDEVSLTCLVQVVEAVVETDGSHEILNRWLDAQYPHTAALTRW